MVAPGVEFFPPEVCYQSGIQTIRKSTSQGPEKTYEKYNLYIVMFLHFFVVFHGFRASATLWSDLMAGLGL